MNAPDSAMRAATDRPRILVVKFNVDYANPTVRLWPHIFLEFADVALFGPGYVSSDALRDGVTAFMRRHGPFDAIVIDDHVFMSALPDTNAESKIRNLSAFFVHRFSAAEAVASSRLLYEQAVASGVPVLLSQFECDSYNIGQSHHDRIRASNLHVIGWGGELYPALADVDTTGEGAWIARANDLWKSLTRDCESRFISMPAMVDRDEFCYRPLADRRHRWAVPGTRYRSRMAARQQLRQLGERMGDTGHYVSMKILRGIGLPMLRNRFLLDIYNGGFRRVLNDTKLAYTCGSALGLPIRKFFEIPAAGAILVCDPCYGFQQLGFRDGENAIACTPEKLPQRFADAPDIEQLQRIAAAGQSLVLRTHSISARAAQMRRCIEAIVAGRFHGSIWENGEFRLRGESHA